MSVRKYAQVEARRVLADLQPGQELPRVPTAPLPAGVLPDPWDTCGCNYEPPQVNGKRVPQRLDPAWQWTEEPSHRGNNIQTALRPQIQLLLWGNDRLGIEACYPITGFHSGDPRFDPPGMADLLLWPIGHPSAAREIKKMGRSPELHQAITLTAMARAGCDVGIWRPCCLLSGHISRQLSAWSGVPLHRNDPFARLGPAQPLTGLAAARKLAVTAGAGAGPAPAAPVACAEVLGAVDDQDATGYVISPAGTVDEQTAITLARMRHWAVLHGVRRIDLMWPWRMVVTAQDIHLQVRDQAVTRWHRIGLPRDLPLPAGVDNIIALVESLNPRTVAVRGVEKCKATIAGPARQPQGVRP